MNSVRVTPSPGLTRYRDFSSATQVIPDYQRIVYVAISPDEFPAVAAGGLLTEAGDTLTTEAGDTLVTEP